MARVPDRHSNDRCAALGGLKEETMTNAAVQEATKTNGATQHALAVVPPPTDGTISAFSSSGNFEAAQRMAKALAASTLVPKEYQGNLPNVLIAMELAARIGVSVFAAMQNLDIIHGRPSWRSQFLIATVNSSGRFTPIRFRFQGKEGTEDWGCRAYAKDQASGDECVGPLITMRLAKEEGWSTKPGSKWKTLPELMLCYRSAAFWARIYAPELSLGMQTVEEAGDVANVRSLDLPGQSQPGNPSELEAQLVSETPNAASEHVDQETGEVTPTAEPEKPKGKRAAPQAELPMRQPGEDDE
jgi:hypothetical protein